MRQAAEAAAFDGGSGSLRSQRGGPVDSTASFTVAAWVSPLMNDMLGTPVYSAALSQEGIVAGSFYLGVRKGRWDFTMKDEDTNEPGHSISTTGPAATADGTSWVQLTGVHDAHAHEIRLYVNGDRVDSQPFTSPWTASGPLTLGRALAHSLPSDFWRGAIGDVRIYDSALSDDQVAKERGSGKPTSPPPAPPDPPKEVLALDGVWVYDMTSEESRRLEGLFGAEAAAAGFPGQASVVQHFARGRWQQYYLIDGQPYLLDGYPEGDGGLVTVKGDTANLSRPLMPGPAYRWSVRDKTLSLRLVTPDPDPVVGFVMEHDYRRVT